MKEVNEEYLKNKPFTRQVLEHALASKGNMSDPGWLGDTSETVIINYTEHIDTIKVKKFKIPLELRVYTNKKISDPYYVLGYWHEEKIETKLGTETKNKFKTVFAIDLSNVKKELKIGKEVYKNVVQVTGVILTESNEARGNGTTEQMYMYLINELGYTILGDTEQYFGARKLWANLSKRLDVKVDILDVSNNKIVEKNVVLHHGKYDKDFDERLWSYNEYDEQAEYQSILTKIL